MVDAHEQDERFTERDLIAAHAERAESEEFRHNKALLVAQHPGCWFNTDLCERDAPIEAHHVVEWSMWPKVDPVRLKALLLAFDPYGYSMRLAAHPITTVDDIRNLLLVCQRHHRFVGHGGHHLTAPTWFAIKARKSGESVTVEELELRGHVQGSRLPSPGDAAGGAPVG